MLEEEAESVADEPFSTTLQAQANHKLLQASDISSKILASQKDEHCPKSTLHSPQLPYTRSSF